MSENTQKVKEDSAAVPFLGFPKARSLFAGSLERGRITQAWGGAGCGLTGAWSGLPQPGRRLVGESPAAPLPRPGSPQLGPHGAPSGPHGHSWTEGRPQPVVRMVNWALGGRAPHPGCTGPEPCSARHATRLRGPRLRLLHVLLSRQGLRLSFWGSEGSGAPPSEMLTLEMNAQRGGGHVKLPL